MSNETSKETSKASESQPKRRKQVSIDEKVNAVLRVLRGEERAAVAKELDVSPERLGKWEATFVGGGRSAVALDSQMAHSSKHRRKLNGGIIAGVAAAILALALSAVVIWRFIYQPPISPLP